MDVDPARLAAASLDPLRVARAIQEANARSTGAGPVSGGGVTRLQAGNSLDRVDALRDVVVSGAAGRSVLLRDVAAVTDEDAEPVSYVRYHSRTEGAHPAVTISVAKRKGANAITVAHLVEQKLDTLRGVVLPRDLTLSRHAQLRRDGGGEVERAPLSHVPRRHLGHGADRARARTPRGGGRAHRHSGDAGTHALRVRPLRLHTEPHHALRADLLDRHPRRRCDRRRGERGAACADADRRESPVWPRSTVRAVDEVGNPTILATLTVVAAILPMAFVGGLMGPYMRPIPIGATAAMLFSLAAAFIVTPWAAVRLLRVDHGHAHATEGTATRLYRRVMARLIDNARARG